MNQKYRHQINLALVFQNTDLFQSKHILDWVFRGIDPVDCMSACHLYAGKAESIETAQSKVLDTSDYSPSWLLKTSALPEEWLALGPRWKAEELGTDVSGASKQQWQTYAWERKEGRCRHMAVTSTPFAIWTTCWKVLTSLRVSLALPLQTLPTDTHKVCFMSDSKLSQVAEWDQPSLHCLKQWFLACRSPSTKRAMAYHTSWVSYILSTIHSITIYNNSKITIRN